MFSKRALAITALCAVILVLTASCGGAKSKAGRFSSSYPLDIHALITFDGRNYEADITVSGKSDMTISFSSPESLGGALLEMKGGECYIHMSGVTLPISDGGYSADNGLLLIRHIFSLSSESFKDANIVKSSGVKYCVESYVTDIGNVSVYFVNDAPLPDKISARLNGHSIDMVIVNE